MDDNENPYQILGVPQNASASQIKAAYRKLALKHHPDRQPDDNAKRQAGEVFAKISNAYEIVGDENNRRAFDAEQQYAQDQRNFQRSNQPHFHHQFHDPFQVFAQAFADEFGNSQRSRGMDPFFSGFSPFGASFFGSPFGQQQQRGGFGQHDPFSDPFFSDPFGRSMGGGGFDMFSQMQQQMDMMRQQSGQGFSSSSFQSSSSTSFSGGARESVSTTTRIVNGKRKTITERIVTKPDGTVERHVETTGDDDFPALQQQEQQLLEQGWQGQEPQLEKDKKKRTKARYR